MKRYYVYTATTIGWCAGLYAHDLHGLWHWLLIFALSGATVAMGWKLELSKTGETKNAEG